jgi:hypothetical protein
MATLPKVSFTSSSESVSLRRFSLQCALFFAPLAAAVAFSAVSLHTVGELLTPERVLELQESAPDLYYPLYQPKSVYPAYKLLGTIKRHPEVLALGSSRIFSIRNEFVRESGNRFYNASMFGAIPIGSMRQFLERLPPNQLPRVLFLDVDPWWFREDAQIQPEPDFYQPASRMQILDFAWRNGLYIGTQRWALSGPSTLIGADAHLQGSGLRPDGSFFAKQRWLDSVPGLLDDQLNDVRKGTNEEFRHGSQGFSHEAIEEMQRLLNFCSDHHVTLIGYLSTYHPSLYNLLRNDSTQDYLWRLAPVLAPRFQEAGALLFDLQDPAENGCTSEEYLDALHEAEVCTVKVLLTMTRRDPRAGAVFDAGKLQGFLSHRRSEWQLGF